MKPLTLKVWFGASALAMVIVACDGEATTPAPEPKSSEDERGSIGVPPPSAEFCEKSGFEVASGACVFPDGTSCEPWSFYRAECGQTHSYCNQHGGTVSTKTSDMGGWTSIEAVCDLDGKQCKEIDFARTGRCA